MRYYPHIFWVRSREIDVDWPYCFGLIFRIVAKVHDSKRHIRQIRIALIWWHTGITFMW